MQKKHLAAIVAAACISLSAVGFTIFAEGGESFSTASDPLVTYSYLQKMKYELTTELRESLKAELKESLKTDLTESIRAELRAEMAAETQYKVLEMHSGQQFLASGACEVILRSGDASVVVTDPVNIASQIGLSDVTAGSELLIGASMPKNHYIIIPRGDGRGFCITSDIAYIMVRGAYTVG
ncbi:MAG: hypothetical protein GX628_02805 [Clostridiales bacterium]|nr:hypothetical protein [Clostridiales bacterium]